MNKKTLKLTGINQSCQEWAQLLKEPYKTKAIKNLNNSFASTYTSSSLSGALNNFNWNNASKEDGIDWSKVVQDLKNGYSSKYINTNVTQLVS